METRLPIKRAQINQTQKNHAANGTTTHVRVSFSQMIYGQRITWKQRRDCLHIELNDV